MKKNKNNIEFWKNYTSYFLNTIPSLPLSANNLSPGLNLPSSICFARGFSNSFCTAFVKKLAPKSGSYPVSTIYSLYSTI